MKVSINKLVPNLDNPRDIVGYEGIYMVSASGDIIPVKPRYRNVKKLRPATDGGGYQVVSLVKNGIPKTKTVHRLVAEAFYGTSNKEVNHKNGNKSDNRLSNLEFVTKSENVRHALTTGLSRPNTKRIAEEKRKRVRQYNLYGQLVSEYTSAHEAARQTGFSRGNISTCCREGIKMYGYLWEYVT